MLWKYLRRRFLSDSIRVIVTFLLENWRSFRDPVTFSMVAGRERRHNDRVPRIDRYQSRVLPIAAVFGGNASGKTNFLRALNFAKRFITSGVRNPNSRIPVQPFKLDEESASRPSRFEFELLIDEVLYRYSFSVRRECVVEEALTRKGRRVETTLYKRNGESIRFLPSLPGLDRLQLAFDCTRENQLFLTNSVLLNIQEFAGVYDWFKEQLEFVAPDSRFAPFEYLDEEVSQHHGRMQDLLAQLDLGVSRLGLEEVSLARILPRELIESISDDLQDDQAAVLAGDPMGDRYLVTRSNGNLAAKKLATFHQGVDGSEVKFAFRDESDGSRRVIDLLRAFLDLTSATCRKVYVIDEFDRSLHTHLAQWLLQYYLLQCFPASRSQLLFTAHDAQLIDQALFRRDEIWVAETNRYGASDLVSFSEYRGIQDDRDIRKSYLQGRLGGVPRILA